MEPYISVTRTRLHEIKQRKKLNNLLSNFESTFSKDRIDGIDFLSTLTFKKISFVKGQKKKLKFFLLVNSDFGEENQSEIDLYITRDLKKYN